MREQGIPICIICREKKEEFSDEHVIPDAIGGYYHIYNVCKDCNSIMGNKIDNKLVSHILSKQLRFLKKLEGKSGEIPNPFDGIHHIKDDDTRKVCLIPDEELGFTPYLLPIISDEKINENEYRISISVDDNDVNKVDDILRKKMQRLGLNKIISKEMNQSSKKGVIVNIHDSFDLVEFKIGLLKIAYEFAVEKIENYFEDKMAVEISDVLRNVNYERVTKYVNIGDGFTKQILTPFEEYLDFESGKHYIILLNNNGKLYCLLSIFHMFIVGVQLSDEPYLDDLEIIIGINDYDKKAFNTYLFYDIINKHTKYSYTYVIQSSTETDGIDFIEETEGEDLPFYSNGKELLLFDPSGKKILTDVLSVITNFYSNRLIGEYVGIQIEIPVPNDHFVKMKSNEKLFKMIKIIENKTTTKI